MLGLPQHVPEAAQAVASPNWGQVREIKVLLRAPEILVADVARRYGMSRTTLYKHVGVVAPRHP